MQEINSIKKENQNPKVNKANAQFTKKKYNSLKIT